MQNLIFKKYFYDFKHDKYLLSFIILLIFTNIKMSKHLIDYKKALMKVRVEN